MFWQVYETTDEAVADAEAVVVGTIVKELGERSVNGVDAPVWTVSIEEWLKGQGAAEIDVASTTQGCEGNTAEDVDMSDPLSDYEGRTVALFLTADGGEWQTSSPFQGVISLDSGDKLPSVWPSKTPFEE